MLMMVIIISVSNELDVLQALAFKSLPWTPHEVVLLILRCMHGQTALSQNLVALKYFQEMQTEKIASRVRRRSRMS